MKNVDSIMKEMKKQILQVSYENQEGHIPSAFSILDLLYVLYHEVMDIDPKQPDKEKRDRLIISKGHASLGIYAMAEAGYIDKSEIQTFGKFNSRLGGHPDRNKVPGIEASTGSLGHGLPIAVGMAMGLKFKETNERVFTIIGDGEANEGSIWEAVMLAAQHQLSNLICILDYNHSGDRAVDLGDMKAKFIDFGWEAYTVNGHDHEALKKVLSIRPKNKPLAIIAETIKGYGCKTLENNPAWHHRSPNKEELEQLVKEVEL